MSPMPGSLVSLNVEVGDEDVEGQEVAVLEAMKVSPPRLPSARLVCHVAGLWRCA
jgi:acetyl/propionyl-CoA carboxylase alpha subunit